MEKSFYETHKNEIKKIGESAKKQLLEDHIPFWEPRVLDREYGGYFNCFDREGKLIKTVKPGWFVGRDMYSFASLYRFIQKKETWLNIAEQGYRYTKGSFYAGNGRFQKLLTREGKILEGTTSIFTDHFAIKGLYEYFKVVPPGEEELAKVRQLTDQLFQNVKDEQILQKEGIRAGWQKHAVNFMTLLVALESFDLFGNRYEDVLRECVRKSLYEFANSELQAPLEYVKQDGRPELLGEGRLVDAGHAMESLWFAMEAGSLLDEKSWKQRAEEVLDWVIERCYDESYGGFIQHIDVDGKEPEKQFLVTDYEGIPAAWDSKIWWVQAEGLNALFMSALLNENEKHFAYFKKLYEYTELYFRDKKYGEWYSILNRDGGVLCDWKGFELKGPYHITRCLMKINLLAEKYLKCKETENEKEEKSI